MPLNRAQRRTRDRLIAARARTRRNQGLDSGLSSLQPGESVSFWVPLRPSEVTAMKGVLAARLPGWDVEIEHPGLDKQEPPAVAAAEGSTTTNLLEQESRGRSTQCAS